MTAIRNTANTRANSVLSLYGQVAGNQREGYKQLAKKLPFVVRSGGLSAGLVFLRSNTKYRTEAQLLLGHLAAVLEQHDGEALIEHVLHLQDPVEYLRMAREALDFAVWVKRLSASDDGIGV